MAETLKLQPHVPERIALAFASGKPVNSPMNGELGIMFTLVDGRVAFLPPHVADAIRSAGIAARQEFEIERTGKGKAQIEVRSLRTQNTERAAATSWQSPAAPSHAAPSNAHQAVQQPHQSTAPDTESNCMMACFKSAIDAIAEAQSYAKRKDLGITFTSENVCSVAITCYINKCKGGR